MVSVLSKTQTFTNGSPNDADPVDSSFVDAFNNDSTLATAVTAIENGSIVNGTTLTINSAYTGGSPGNMAFVVERGTLANTGFRWNETKTWWEVTHNGTNYYPISLVVTADPGTPVEGMTWYNSTDNAWRFYDGAATQTVTTKNGIYSFVTKTANYTALATDIGKTIRATANTWTLSFTAAATLGNGWFCHFKNEGTGNITLNPNGAETINGLTSFVAGPGTELWIGCDGTGFFTMGKIYFQSSAVTISTSAADTVAHGLGVIPKYVDVWIRCTSIALGHAVGDLISVKNLSFDQNATRNWGLDFSMDATNIYLVQGASGITIPDRSSAGAWGSASSANFEIILKGSV